MNNLFTELYRLFPNSNPHTLQFISDNFTPLQLGDNWSEQHGLPQNISNDMGHISSDEKDEQFPDFSILVEGNDIYDFDQLSLFQCPEPSKNESPVEMLPQSKKIKKEENLSKLHKEISNSKSIKTQKTKKNPGRRETWKGEEDSQLIELHKQYGPQWSKIAAIMGNRTGKQVRDRYLNILNPDISHDEWTVEEEILFASLCQKFGNKWCKIAKHMPGRTGNQVKNKFYCEKKRNFDTEQNKAPKNFQNTTAPNLSKKASVLTEETSPESVSEYTEIMVVKETVDVFFEFEPIEASPNTDDVLSDNFRELSWLHNNANQNQ